MTETNKGTWGGKREGAGRPSTLGREGRRKNRGILFNDAEYEELKRAAAEAELSISEYVRINVL